MQKLLKFEILPRIYQVIPLQSNITIGRDPSNTVILSDRSVSSRHAQIRIDGDNVWLEDLDSTNGTKVNEVSISKKCLEDGNRIDIGYIAGYFVIENSIQNILENVPIAEINFDDNTVYQFHYTESYAKDLVYALEKYLQQQFLNLRDIKRYTEAIYCALKNAHCHGNQNDPNKKITIQFHIKKEEWKCRITDEGNGFPYKQILSQYQNEIELDTKHGLHIISDNTSYLEFNATGNSISLIKINATIAHKSKHHTELLPKTFYFSCKFFQRVWQKRSYPLKVCISLHPIKSIPETCDSIASHVASSTKPIISVEPICPGCIVMPSCQTIQEEISQHRMTFWITPLSEDRNIKASIQLASQGKILSQIMISFKAYNVFLTRLLFLFGGLLPILGILLDIPYWKIDAEVPALIRHFISCIQCLGGTSTLGIFWGLVCLGLGVFRYWKTMPKADMIQEKKIEE